ncbi:MAG: hypothetical protein KDD11_19000 [Acidobacteria bacterium]|nr:hypothetical protein [Acidobacteriota bacterium]
MEIDDGKIQEHLRQLICGTVERTLNQLLEAEAEAICQASRYVPTDSCKD